MKSKIICNVSENSSSIWLELKLPWLTILASVVSLQIFVFLGNGISRSWTGTIVVIALCFWGTMRVPCPCGMRLIIAPAVFIISFFQTKQLMSMIQTDFWLKRVRHYTNGRKWCPFAWVVFMTKNFMGGNVCFSVICQSSCSVSISSLILLIQFCLWILSTPGWWCYPKI